MLAPGIVGVLELRYAQDTLATAPALCILVHLGGHLRLGLRDDRADDVGLLEELVDEALGNVAHAAEAGLLQGHLLFGLRAEGRVLDEAVDEDPELVLDVDRLDLRALTGLLLGPCLNAVHELVDHMLHVGSTLGRADRVHKGAVLEAVAIRSGNEQLPSLADVRVHVALCRVKEAAVVGEVLHRELLSVQEDGAALVAGAGNVVDSLPHEVDRVGFQLGHAELRKVWPELHAREVFAGVLLDLWLVLPAHVASPLLVVELPLACRLYDEAVAENVGQLCAKPVAASSDLLLGVVVVVTGQQVAEDEFWHIHLVLLVNLDRQPLAVVHDFDPLLLRVNLHFDRVHVLVPLQVVRGIHEDLVKYLVECRDIGDLAGFHFLFPAVPHPERVILLLHRSNICVWSQEDVLYLGLLLVNLLNRLTPFQLSPCITALTIRWRPCFGLHGRILHHLLLHRSFWSHA
mmetsp:Transcript_87667/g.256283  ORF Transcript_87667/g.256283 Transcript_87667/m.256283 type:complete len:460 (-) Transcript_87667:94-1473(-)